MQTPEQRTSLLHLALVVGALTMACAKPVAVRADGRDVSSATTATVTRGDMHNPFTLVYGGAITKNQPGKVNIHPVMFSDTNNVEIANLLSKFLAEKHLDGGGRR